MLQSGDLQQFPKTFPAPLISGQTSRTASRQGPPLARAEQMATEQAPSYPALPTLTLLTTPPRHVSNPLPPQPLAPEPKESAISQNSPPQITPGVRAAVLK